MGMGIQRTGIEPLYKNIKDPSEAATASLAAASKTYGSMSQAGTQKTETGAPPKTFGGGLLAGGTMALAGASAGAMMMASTEAGAMVGGVWGAGIGLALGLAAYYLS